MMYQMTTNIKLEVNRTPFLRGVDNSNPLKKGVPGFFELNLTRRKDRCVFLLHFPDEEGSSLLRRPLDLQP